MTAEMTDAQREEISNNFKRELRELLEKYNASIDWSCGQYSDLQGVYDEEMVVGFNVAGIKNKVYDYSIEKRLAHGSSVSAYELGFSLGQ